MCIRDRGPVFANLVLADEINRAPAKVQSALLEVMQERQVTIGRETFQAPDPFLVMATQNPIEMEGTYPVSYTHLIRWTWPGRRCGSGARSACQGSPSRAPASTSSRIDAGSSERGLSSVT